MNTFHNTPEEQNLKITYPGITVESIPWKRNIYEVVWNCGGTSILFWMLQKNPNNIEILKIVTRIFESIHAVNNQVIFIVDESIIQSNNPIIENIGKEIFWPENFALIWVSRNPDKSKNNSISGLRINATQITHEDILIESIRQMPEATIISSIPVSDPRIHSINTTLATENLQNTTAAKTLQLLDLNSKKSNQIRIEWVKEMTKYINIAHNHEELKAIFDHNRDKKLVIKSDEWAAGGTSVNFISENIQQNHILSSLQNEDFPQIVYEFIEPTLIKNWEEKYPVQFRPMISNQQEYIGGAIKIPAEPLKKDTFISGASKQTFRRQNNSLNTSSWQTHTFFFDHNGEPVAGVISERDGYKMQNKDETHAFLKNFQFENTQTVSGEEIFALSEGIIQEVANIQKETNTLLSV